MSLVIAFVIGLVFGGGSAGFACYKWGASVAAKVAAVEGALKG